MKAKYLLFFAIVCLSLFRPAHGQHQYYFNVGDTIRGRDTTYYYQWWSDDYLNNDETHHAYYESFALPELSIYPAWHGKILKYCYTEQPINIVGISTSLFLYDYSTANGWLHPNDALPMEPEWLLLYEADTSREQFREVGRIPFSISQPARYMDVELRHPNDTYHDCCAPSPTQHIIEKLREFYFDKPITVYDSFYVGHTQYTNWFWTQEEPIPADYYPTNIGCKAIVAGWNQGCPYECNDTILHKYKIYRDDWLADCPYNYVDSGWHFYENIGFMLEFPIIEVDSSFYDGPPAYVCPPVNNFRVGGQGEDNAVLLWDTHGDHQSWQVSYGPAGTDPDNGIIVNCPIQVCQLSGLDSCTPYVAYIRAVCDHDSLVYSQWSDSVRINICSTNSAIGDAYAEADPLTFLVPNPAYDQVQVFSSFGMRRVEVYDLSGRQVLSADATGHSALFSVRDWRPGLYVAVIRTQGGNFAKKLVVR